MAKVQAACTGKLDRKSVLWLSPVVVYGVCYIGSSIQSIVSRDAGSCRSGDFAGTPQHPLKCLSIADTLTFLSRIDWTAY